MASLAIPTYGREQILLDTIDYLLELDTAPADLIVLDQSKKHMEPAARRLGAWHASGAIRWLRLPTPCIPCAMNRGLIEAAHSIVVFVDDDIVPEPGLLQAHADAHATTGAALVAGRIIQPWQEGLALPDAQDFH